MNARIRRICIAAAIILVSFIALAILGYTQLMSYLQGNDFRHRVADAARSATGAQSVDIASNFIINGNRVSTEGVTITGLRNIQDARAGRISVEIDRAALLGRRIRLHKVSMEDASLQLSTGSSPSAAQAKQTRKTTPRKNRKPKSNAQTKDAPSFRELSLELLECKDADLQLTHHGKAYQLLGANVIAQPAPRIGHGAWQLSAENARLHTPFSFLRDCSIKSATAVYQDNSVDITECRIMLTPGEMRVKAHYDIKQNTWSSELQVNKGDLHRLLNDDWKKRITGDLYGRMILTGDKNGISTGSGSFSVQNGVLESLPFLSQIPVGNTYPYRSLEIEKAECQILFPYNGDKMKEAWLFDKINIRSRDGALLVHGHILIGTDRKLGGTLTIGLPKALISALPLSPDKLTNKLFTAVGDDDAYFWVNMNLSGTIDNPQEDLSIRIATLAGQNLSKMLKNISAGTAGELLDSLLKQKSSENSDKASSSKEQTGELIKDAVDTAGSLLKSLF